MMMGKEDLGLSLSLSFPAETRTTAINPMQRNLIPSTIISPSPAPPSAFNNLITNNYWTTHPPFPHSSSDRNTETCRLVETRSFLKGIDVNRMPATAEEEEGGVSSPNSTISSLSGNKRSEREGNCIEENEMERDSSRGISDEDDGETCRKKLRLTKEQSAVLEDSFKDHHTLNPKQKLALAKKLGLRPRQVEVWFQNRRARTKLKQTEVDCEFLKRCVENLTDENRRLQKEVHELRSLKHSPQFYMQMSPPTTLTMCPSCERVATGPTNTPVNISPHRIGPPHQHHQPMPLNMWGPSSTTISQGQYGPMDTYPTLARQK